MSNHNYIRTLVDGFWDTDIPSLSRSVKAALPGEVFTLRAAGTAVVFDFVDDLTAPEIATLDSEVTANQAVAALDTAKNQKCETVDSLTRELISAGFEYPTASGIIFSLSDNAQRTLITADAQRLDPLFAYPVTWNSKDDETTISFADAAELHAFVMTAVGTTRAWLDSGTGLKDQVRAAATVAAVEAIVDNR